MTQRSKWTDRAKRYLSSQDAIAGQLWRQMRDNDWQALPDNTPLSIRLFVWQPSGLHKCDLSNVLKAVEDAAQGIVFRNDCWVDKIETGRYLGSEYRCEFLIEIMESETNDATN
jgi:Holliday junction resolvase RusA-like endonuclease